MRYKEENAETTEHSTFPKRHKYEKFKWRKLLIPLAFFMIFAGGTVFACNWIMYRYDKCIFNSIEDVPEREYGMVLGCSKYFMGKRNMYFLRRIQAAAALYHAGKIKKIVVSGTNHVKEYNEPEDMRDDLIQAGVPEEDILCDYAGRRTLDSMIRMNTVFHQPRYMVITQKPHCRRALFIAQNHGLDVIGYSADYSPRNRFIRIRNEIRETLACVKACADIYILRKRPKFEQ